MRSTRRTASRRGTILVVILGILAVLALVGAAMIKVTRVDNFTAQSFKQATDMDYAVDSVLEYVEYTLVKEYYDKLDDATGGTYFGSFDSPHDPDCLIALMTLDPDSGKLVKATQPYESGLYLTSANTPGPNFDPMRAWYNIPTVSRLPAPADLGKTEPAMGINNHLPDGDVWSKDANRYAETGADRVLLYTGDGREIQFSVTVLDLSARYNANFHFGIETMFNPQGLSGQSFGDPGVHLTEVAPDWQPFNAQHARSPVSFSDQSAQFQIQLNQERFQKSWEPQPLPEFDDQTMNYFDPSNKKYLRADKYPSVNANDPLYEDRPFGDDDLLELLIVNGTPFQSRLETVLPNTLNRSGRLWQGGRWNNEPPDRRSWARMLYTTFSCVSTTRHLYTEASDEADREWNGALAVKADLNHGPEETGSSTVDELMKNPLRASMLASGLFGEYDYTKNEVKCRELDQIIVNIMDYRDADTRPSAIKVGTPDDSDTDYNTSKNDGYVVFGVDAQPYINEVYVHVTDPLPEVQDGPDSDGDGNPDYTYREYDVFIELANPYKQELKHNQSYTKLVFGKDSNKPFGNIQQTIGDLPDIEACAVNQYQRGKIVRRKIKVLLSEDGRPAMTPEDEDADAFYDYLFPIELFASAKQRGGADTWEIVIDRMVHEPSNPTYVPTEGRSLQRLACMGTRMMEIGPGLVQPVPGTVFFGGWADRTEIADVTMGGDLDNPVFTANEVDDGKTARPIENRGKMPDGEENFKRYEADEMSFRRIGDLARVLAIGHVRDHDDFDQQRYMAVTQTLALRDDDNVGRHYVNILSRNEHRALTNYVTVQSPFYDNVDNDGDGEPRDFNTTTLKWNKGAGGVDEKDAVFLEPSDDEYAVNDLAQEDTDRYGPEIYEFGKINLKTAPPEVIRGMLPAALRNPAVAGRAWTDDDLFKLAQDICNYAQSDLYNNPGNERVRIPADILDAPLNLSGKGSMKTLFTADGVDDDGNGAVDDWAERSWIYGFMSNWASCRSDSFVVYGTIRLVGEGGRVDGVRRFISVLDRTPATAYRPMIVQSSAPTLRPNPHYLGVRRVFTTWTD